SGAHHFCLPCDLIDVVSHVSGSRGASAVLDFVGSTQTMELAERALGTRGRLVVVGSTGGQVVLDKSRTGVRRGLSYHIPVWGTLPELEEAVDLARKGALRPTVSRT